MIDERKKLLELIDSLNVFPTGWDEHYLSVRSYIAEKLREKYPEHTLINFHFTPGEDFMKYTKEEMWEFYQETMDPKNCVECTPMSDIKKPIDVRKLVEDL